MKKIIFTGIACAAIAIGTPAWDAQAAPDMCAGQMDQKDASSGFHPGEKSIPACEEDGGMHPWNNAQTPDAAPHPDAREPMTPVDQSGLGTYGSKDTQSVFDEDGIQGHDNVTNSPMYVPQAHS